MTSWRLTGFTEERELGSGGSGRVVLARHEATGNEVAIKYLAGWLAGDASHLSAFRTEAELMAGLVDPHLVTLYEYVETTAGAAIVMDLLDGVALRKMLDEGGPLSPQAALTLMKGSLLGLAALHAQGVVHRDYKPENVMVDAAGGTKLVDYGIAAPVGEIAGVSGTPLYMAPEQWRGEPSNAATDVYAATATFVECLTGHPVFAGRTIGALLHQHLTAAPALDDIPEPVRPIAEAGLAKDPAVRLGDAKALLARLDVLAPAAYGPDWEAHGRAHLAARAALLALLFAHPERVAHEQPTAQTNLGGGGSTVFGDGGSAGAGAAGDGGARTTAAAEAVGAEEADAAERRRRSRPLTFALGALVIAGAVLALTRHADDSPRSSNAAFQQGAPTVPLVAASPTKPSPRATPTPTLTPGPSITAVPSPAPAPPVSPPASPSVSPTISPTLSPTLPPTSAVPTIPPFSAPTTSPPPGLSKKQPPTSPSPSLPPPAISTCVPTAELCGPGTAL